MSNMISIAIAIATFLLSAYVYISQARSYPSKKKRIRASVIIIIIGLIISLCPFFFNMFNKIIFKKKDLLLNTKNNTIDSLRHSNIGHYNDKINKDSIKFPDTENNMSGNEINSHERYGYIIIGTDPPNCQIYIDKKFKGTTTKTIKLSLGEHHIKLISPESLHYEDVFEIRNSDKNQAYFYDFKRNKRN